MLVIRRHYVNYDGALSGLPPAATIRWTKEGEKRAAEILKASIPAGERRLIPNGYTTTHKRTARSARASGGFRYIEPELGNFAGRTPSPILSDGVLLIS